MCPTLHCTTLAHPSHFSFHCAFLALAFSTLSCQFSMGRHREPFNPTKHTRMRFVPIAHGTLYHWDQFTHPNLYHIDGTHVAFIRLIANVEHTWQTSRDHLVDTVQLLQDRNPQTAIIVPHAPY